MDSENAALRAEVERLRFEKEKLYATVRCDQIQEETLAKFSAALQVISNNQFKFDQEAAELLHTHVVPP